MVEFFGRRRLLRRSLKRIMTRMCDEEKHRLLETRIAQLGAALLAVGFAMQIWGNVTEG